MIVNPIAVDVELMAGVGHRRTKYRRNVGNPPDDVLKVSKTRTGDGVATR